MTMQQAIDTLVLKLTGRPVTDEDYQLAFRIVTKEVEPSE